MKCDDRILLELLESDIADESAVTHIEQCKSCQSRLTSLAADEDSWSNVVVALASDDEFSSHSSVVVTVDKELSPDMPMQADCVSLDFLDEPKHPEMLGRVGRYDVERLIGAGGMGIVLKAFDTDLHRPVAVKVLAPHLAHSGAARQRFAREAKSAAAVVHENVVPIHNVDVTGKLPFLVMRYVAGDSLQGRVDTLGPLGTDEILRIGAQIAHGLAAAHEQGLVHRDVKPGNVLMEESVDRVLISDFGLARAADDASVTRSGVIAGTPHYMSPEQARGELVDARSDLFGLGSVLYFMCTGRPPFRAEGAMGTLNRICHTPHRPVDEVNEQIPAGLAELIDQLLSKSAGDRPATASEVATQLTSFLHDKRSRKQFRRRKGRRRLSQRGWLVGTCSLLLVAVAAGVASWNLWHGNARKQDAGYADAAIPVPVTSRDAGFRGGRVPQGAFASGDPGGTEMFDSFPEPPALLDQVGEGRFDSAPRSNSSSSAGSIPEEVTRLPFYDPEFFAEINQIDSISSRLEQSPFVAAEPFDESNRLHWDGELNVTQAMVDAIERGATKILLPGQDDKQSDDEPVSQRDQKPAVGRPVVEP